jgi:cytolysin-activating lysine-acyltransferase
MAARVRLASYRECLHVSTVERFFSFAAAARFMPSSARRTGSWHFAAIWSENVEKTEQQKAEEARLRIQAAVGQVVLAMSSTPRYRQLPFGDLQALVLDPLMRDRVALANARHEDGTPIVGGIAGIAFWASVSAAVDAKIRDQIAAGGFPVRLKSEDWASGDQVWLLDIIAPTQKAASSVLASFNQIAKTAEVRLHPMALRQVDPELLKQMNVAKA